MLASLSLVKNILSAICAALHALSATAYAGEQDNANQTQEKAQEIEKMEKENEKQKLRNSLLEYCKLDTLAMVKILQKLREVYNFLIAICNEK